MMSARHASYVKTLAGLPRNYRGGTVFVLTFLLTALFIAVVGVYLERARSLVVLDVTAELVTQSVTRADLASVPLANARQTLGRSCIPEENAEPVNAVLRPENGATLQYRWTPDRIAVTVAAPEGRQGTQLRYFDEHDEYRECILVDRLNSFVIELYAPDELDASEELEASDERALARAWPLPIAGPAEVGAEFGVINIPKAGEPRDFNLLMNGTLQVVGKATMPSARNALVPALSEALAIPAGSRLTSLTDPDAPPDAAGAPWYGLAIVAPNGFRVSATTEASQLYIYRPGIDRDQRELIEVGLFAQFLNDPSLAIIALGLAAFVAIAQVISGWVGVWRVPESPECRDQKSATSREPADRAGAEASKDAESAPGNTV